MNLPAERLPAPAGAGDTDGPAAAVSRPAVRLERGRVVVLSSLFPSDARPAAGLFVRERMFRLARHRPVLVVSPQPWFPLQGLIRRLRPGYRPMAAAEERQRGVRVYYPRFFSLPGVGRCLDGFFMGLATWWLLKRLQRREALQLIDSHFAYPDGYAATWAGRRLGVPVCITLRGTEVPLSRTLLRRGLMRRALLHADRVFAVSDSLRRLAVALGVPAERTRVVGNGVDAECFRPVDRHQARAALGLPADAKVLVSVGALVERKGFHRVIELLPRLRERFPTLRYLVVGGASPEGDCSAMLREQVRRLGLEEVVSFLGPLPPEELKLPLSAADVFVLATSNEGWANVFLEAMACGLPVVSTRVGGNEEVVCREDLGCLVPFGEPGAMRSALEQALARDWDRAAIRRYAEDNTWDTRVQVLREEFERLAPGRARVGRDAGRPLRLALVGPLPPPAGGMANQTRQLARLLASEGIDVDLIPTNSPPPGLWAAELRWVRALPRLLVYVAALWRAFGRADVCHLMANSGWSWHLFAAPAIWIGWLRGVPVLVNYRGGQAGEFLARQVSWVRPTLRRAAALVVPSGFLRQVFGEHGFDALMVPNIIDLARFHPGEAPPEGSFDILVARNLEPLYGIDTAIRALALLRAEFPGATLTVAGSGPAEEELRRLAASLGVAGAVRFTGSVASEDMPRLFQQARVALNPSLADNMPNSVLEALAAGRPVVSTRVGGVPFLVTDERTALLVPPADPQAMARALLRLARDPVLAEALARRGLEEVGQYAWTRVRERLLALYGELAAAGARVQGAA